MNLPIKIYTKKSKLNGFVGFSFLIFIFIAVDSKDIKRTINHETIHYYQQLELLFIFFFLIYILNFIINLFRFKFNIKYSYLNIIFEKEAYKYEANLDYLKQDRKLFNWIKHLK
jgi:cell division protein FtsB